MKLSVAKSALHPALSALRGFVSPSGPKPSTAFILFDPPGEGKDGNGISLYAYDGEIELVYQLAGAEIKDSGKGMVAALKILSISSNSLEDEVIVLNCSDDKTEVDSPHSRFKIGALPADQFAKMDELGKEDARIEVRADDLRLLIEKTEFSMADGSDGRAYLNGMLLSAESKRLLAAATDGHRLAVCQIPHERKGGEEIQVILPRRAAQELKRLLPQTEETVAIGVGEKQVRVTFGAITMGMKLLDGKKYPDFKRVIPSDFTHVISIDSETLRRTLSKIMMVEQGSLVPGETASAKLAFSKNQLVVTSRFEQDEAEVEQEVEYSGQDFDVGFNPQYLRDVLAVIESERVLFEFKDPSSAVQIRESESETAKYVVMPLRL